MAGAYLSMRWVYMGGMEPHSGRIIKAGHIKATAVEHVIVASEAERAALAARLGLPGVALLRGVFVLHHEQGGVIAAELHMTARVEQVCVVSLEPFAADVEERSALRFVPASHFAEAEALELDELSLEGPDEIPYAGDVIDLGEALAEQLALALEPYPRKPGAALPEAAFDDVVTPFSVLAARRRAP